jgi:hypothetical protein
MLLLKLSDACFIDDDNTDINEETSEFVLQYIFNCCSGAELNEIGMAVKGPIKETDVDKLPMVVKKEIKNLINRRTVYECYSKVTLCQEDRR